MVAFWYRALSTPLGIEIVCSNIERVREKLYTSRKEVQDTDLDCLSILRSPFDPDRLWIVKRGKE